MCRQKQLQTQQGRKHGAGRARHGSVPLSHSGNIFTSIGFQQQQQHHCLFKMAKFSCSVCQENCKTDCINCEVSSQIITTIIIMEITSAQTNICPNHLDRWMPLRYIPPFQNSTSVMLSQRRGCNEILCAVEQRSSSCFIVVVCVKIVFFSFFFAIIIFFISFISI